MIYPQRCGALSAAESSQLQRHVIRVKKANRYRSGRAGRESSGAPTPTGVGLDDLIQEFADDQHGEGLIHTFPHSNLAEQRVQYGAAHAIDAAFGHS